MATINLPLSSDGPIVEVCVDLSAANRQYHLAAGLPLPKRFVGRGLIDTGASISAVDLSIVVQLGLPVTGSRAILTPSTGNHPFPSSTHDASFWLSPTSTAWLPGRHPFLPVCRTLRIIAVDFTGQNIDVLIGRDILDLCHFAYDGRAQRMVLDF